MAEVPQNDYHIIVKLNNGRSVFGMLKRYSEGVIVLETDRPGKIPLSKIHEIIIVKDSELTKTKKDFGLRY